MSDENRVEKHFEELEGLNHYGLKIKLPKTQDEVETFVIANVEKSYLALHEKGVFDRIMISKESYTLSMIQTGLCMVDYVKVYCKINDCTEKFGEVFAMLFSWHLTAFANRLIMLGCRIK